MLAKYTESIQLPYPASCNETMKTSQITVPQFTELRKYH